MRYLGIDYGERRIGLAFADELGLALPVGAVAGDDPERRWVELGKVVAGRRVEAFVVGFPFNMDGSVGFKAREVEAFVGELRARFSLPVHIVDERLTTYAAASLGKRPKRDRIRAARRTGELDARAAALILQDFLDAGAVGETPESIP